MTLLKLPALALLMAFLYFGQALVFTGVCIAHACAMLADRMRL
jgi:hypothetical protein